MKSVYFWLGERSILLPWFVNLLTFNIRALGWLPSRFRDRRRSYATESGHQGSQPTSVDYNDLGLNLYCRLIVQNRYDLVIELGALSLERSRWLAEHFPQTRVHALDITQDFAVQRCIDGVHVGPNNLANIRAISLGHRRGLVCAHGTLCCYPQNDLAELLFTLRELKIDLAFSEPNTLGEGSLSRSLKRTGQSYYHPYLKMLRKAGFELPDNNGHQVRDCWGEYAETRTFLFACCR